eukprot:scaffold16150_cov112-Cylindrotheca_fusiformis.AAC.5
MIRITTVYAIAIIRLAVPLARMLRADENFYLLRKKCVDIGTYVVPLLNSTSWSPDPMVYGSEESE